MTIAAMMKGPLPPVLGGGGVDSAILAFSKSKGGADYSYPSDGTREFRVNRPACEKAVQLAGSPGSDRMSSSVTEVSPQRR